MRKVCALAVLPAIVVGTLRHGYFIEVRSAVDLGARLAGALLAELLVRPPAHAQHAVRRSVGARDARRCSTVGWESGGREGAGSSTSPRLVPAGGSLGAERTKSCPYALTRV